MSFLSTRCLPSLRNISPCLRKVLFPRNAIQRSYWGRRDSFSELSTAMRSVENYMREMDKEMNRIFGSSPVKLPRIFDPFNFSRFREIPVVSTGEGKSYKLDLDMKGMEPENINITLKDHDLTVTARRDEKREDGSRFVRENTYHYTLPSEINPDTVRSTLADGILTIEAALPAVESKEIPINVECEQKSSSDSDSEKNK